MAESDRRLQNQLRKYILEGNTTVVSRLIKGGVSVNDTTWFDSTLLHEAVVLPPTKGSSESEAARERTKFSIIEVLLRNGADANARDKNGRTPLHYVARTGDCKTIEQLHKKGACVNVVTEDGRSPLHVALWQKREPAALILIKLGANVNLPDEDGTTPLHWAAKVSSVEVLWQLLKKGANINQLDKQGFSPLHYSVRGQPDVMRVLLTQGADTTIKTKSGKTLMHLLDEVTRQAGQSTSQNIVHNSSKFKMILRAGYPIHKDHRLLQRKLDIFQKSPDLLRWMEEVEDQYPSSLLNLSRCFIRKHLTNIRGSKLLEEKLSELGGILPDAVIDSLSVAEQLSEFKLHV